MPERSTGALPRPPGRLEAPGHGVSDLRETAGDEVDEEIAVTSGHATAITARRPVAEVLCVGGKSARENLVSASARSMHLAPVLPSKSATDATAPPCTVIRR